MPSITPLHLKETRCPSCSLFVDVDVGVCQHCGYELTSEDRLAISDRMKKQNNAGGLVAFVLAVTVLVVGAYLFRF